MNRKEYMKSLEDALWFLSEETRAAALEFYGEMIDDRMEDGMDELSAVAAMEAPEDIAARLRTENPWETQETAADNGAPEAEFGASMRDEAMEFSSLADQVMQTVRQAIEGVPELVNAGMEAAQAGIEEAARNIGEAAEQLREARETDEGTEGGYTCKVFSCPAAQVRAVALHAVDMPIRIVPCGGETLTLRYYTSEKAPYTLTLEDGVMTLRHPEQTLFRGGFSLVGLGNLFRMTWGSSAPTIRLEMPADLLIDLTAHTSNGSVKAGGFSMLCQVDLKTSNSRIELEDTVCKALTVASSNGRLVMKNVACRQRLQAKTSNSRIEAESVGAGEDMTLHTSNGRIQAKALSAKGEINIKTSNGSITVEELQAERVTLKTSNGSISGVLPGAQSDWAIDSGTSNGHNSLPASQPGYRPLSVHTSNGSIRLGFREG